MTRHPVHTLLAEAAYEGREVTEEELKELQLSAADTAQVRKAGREAAFQHAGGDQGRAHEHAHQRAREIIGSLPEEQRDPRYLHEPDNLDSLGPAELAARIPR